MRQLKIYQTIYNIFTIDIRDFAISLSIYLYWYDLQVVSSVAAEAAAMQKIAQSAKLSRGYVVL